MKTVDRKIFFVIAVVILGACTAMASYRLAMRDRLPNMPPPVIAAEMPGDRAMIPEQQAFETMVRDLMFVSLDDVDHGWGERRIDMGLRRNSFNSPGWTQYQAFVARLKETLKREHLAGGSGASQAIARFVHGTQQYGPSPVPGRKAFSTKGHFCFGKKDAYACREEIFALSLTFTGDATAPDDVVLQGWDVKW